MSFDKCYGLAIDPGMSTGVCLFSWGTEQPYRQEGWWQIPGGVFGLMDFLDKHKMVSSYLWETVHGVSTMVKQEMFFDRQKLDVLIVEKFTPHGGAGYSLTRASVEPLRCEGALIGRDFGPCILWREPGAQYFMGGLNLPDRKKRSREFLKQHGIYITGSMVGQPDADDAISAELHAISWMRWIRHLPTLYELFTEEEE